RAAERPLCAPDRRLPPCGRGKPRTRAKAVTGWLAAWPIWASPPDFHPVLGGGLKDLRDDPLGDVLRLAAERVGLLGGEAVTGLLARAGLADQRQKLLVVIGNRGVERRIPRRDD